VTNHQAVVLPARVGRMREEWKKKFENQLRQVKMAVGGARWGQCFARRHTFPNTNSTSKTKYHWGTSGRKEMKTVQSVDFQKGKAKKTNKLCHHDMGGGKAVRSH